MTDLKADLCVILQDVKHVPLGASLEPIAERIIATLADALTSDAAVDAMLECSFGYLDYDQGTTYRDVPEEEREQYRVEGRFEITAALDAITERSQDGATALIAGMSWDVGADRDAAPDTITALINGEPVVFRRDPATGRYLGPSLPKRGQDATEAPDPMS